MDPLFGQLLTSEQSISYIKSRMPELNPGRDFLKDMRRKGSGPGYVRSGHRVLYPQAEIDYWLTSIYVVPDQPTIEKNKKRSTVTYEVTVDQWLIVWPCIPLEMQFARSEDLTRRFFNGCLFLAANGKNIRSLPSVYSRDLPGFHRLHELWIKTGLWEFIMTELSACADFPFCLITKSALVYVADRKNKGPDVITSIVGPARLNYASF